MRILKRSEPQLAFKANIPESTKTQGPKAERPGAGNGLFVAHYPRAAFLASNFGDAVISGVSRAS